MRSLRCIGVGALLAVAGIIAVALPASATIRSAAIIPSPNITSGISGDNHLESVSCLSTSFCVAVGSHVTADGSRTSIFSWNGTSWAFVNSPNSNLTPTDNNRLLDVSCTSVTSCLAVGYYDSTSSSGPLVLAFDGSTWTLAATPIIPNSDNVYPDSVSCSTATSCMATGSYFENSVQGLFIASWDGVSWTLLTLPNLSSQTDLGGIDCFAATTCTAVGYYDSNGFDHTLILTWDGTAFTQVASPTTGTHDNRLYSVSCTSAASCTAVGRYTNDASIRQTLALTWDGSTWTHLDSPNFGDGNNRFDTVSCASPTSCTAVGYFTVNDVTQALIEYFDGSSWQAIAEPSDLPTTESHLYGVSCIAVNLCLAVGDYRPVDSSATLTLSLTGPEPTTTTTTSTEPRNMLTPTFTG